ncbi:MAG TPA: pitrilysin family protein [Polyangia bacterium]|jgi:zinc protease|nr:pitrilysin family protein [Polyangia bacterium]
MRAQLLAALLFATTTSAATSSPPDLSHPPKLPPPPKWTAPAPGSATTGNGVRVVVLPEHGLPIAYVLVTIAAGSASDPAAHPGLAAATAMMLQDGGAGGKSAPELADALAALGGELRTRVEPDEVKMQLVVLARNLGPALQLLGDVVARPRFDAAEWPKAQARRLDEIRRHQDEPRFVADEVFARVLYGDHPYGHPSLGTPASVAALTVDDVRRFWSEHYGPKTTTIIVAGDAALEATTATVGKALGAWTSSAVEPAVPPPAPPSTARVVLVDRPGAPQSELRVGYIGRDRKTPDFAPILLLETVLGGSFTSRLNQNLREKHGYTYGARAHFQLDRAPGPFVASAAVRTDVTAESVKETVGELARMRTPLSPDEVVKGRSLVLSAIVDAFADGQETTNFLAELTTHDLPLDTWSRVPAELEKLDVPSLGQAAMRLFHPEQLVILVVGDRKAIDAPLRKLPFVKAIEYRDVQGRVVK